MLRVHTKVPICNCLLVTSISATKRAAFQGFSGQLDQMNVFNKKLSSTEIRDIYRLLRKRVPENLQGGNLQTSSYLAL